MDSVYAARNVAPPSALLDGVLVNTKGERFTNEESYSGYLGLAIADQPEGTAWLILPSKSFYRAVKQALFGGWLFFKFYRSEERRVGKECVGTVSSRGSPYN